MKQNLERQNKHGKKKIKPMKNKCSENEIPGSNSLKPFEFERNTNIGDINSSSCDRKKVQKQPSGGVLQLAL